MELQYKLSEYLFSYSETGENEPRRGVGAKLPAIAGYTLETLFPTILRPASLSHLFTARAAWGASRLPFSSPRPLRPLRLVPGRARRLAPPPLPRSRPSSTAGRLSSPSPISVCTAGVKKGTSSLNPNPRGEGEEEGRLLLFDGEGEEGRREAPRLPLTSSPNLTRYFIPVSIPLSLCYFFARIVSS